MTLNYLFRTEGIKMSKKLVLLAQAAAVVMVLSACGTTPPPKQPAPPVQEKPVEAEPAPQVGSRAELVEAEPTTTTKVENLTEVERRFAEGMNEYNDGNYPNAIRIFREPVFSRAWPELRIRSLKYLAFSYCVANNAPQCRRTFDQIFKLDPTFQLSSAESGHPIWGPVFKQAKVDSSKSTK